jgi:hypothetical protein
MTPAKFLDAVINPGLALLPTVPVTPEAQVLLLAIAGQESGLIHTYQMNGGPARGPWQFEPIGLAEVRRHPASRRLFRALPRVADSTDQFERLATDLPYAAAVARLALLRDPRPLPVIGSEAMAWGYYEGLWRPGRPRPETWRGHYAAAVAAVGW